VAALAYPAPAAACLWPACGPPPAEFSQADAAFTGRVISIVDQDALTQFVDRLRHWTGLAPPYRASSIGWSGS
jgi:hypothetical protein